MTPRKAAKEGAMEPFLLIFGILFGLMFVSATVKMLTNWERAVVLRLGKFNRMAGRGPSSCCRLWTGPTAWIPAS